MNAVKNSAHVSTIICNIDICPLLPPGEEDIGMLHDQPEGTRKMLSYQTGSSDKCLLFTEVTHFVNKVDRI